MSTAVKDAPPKQSVRRNRRMIPASRVAKGQMTHFVISTILPLCLTVAWFFAFPVFGFADLIIFGMMWACTAGLGISIAYHRYFTHRSFQAHPALKAVLAAAGSISAQGPITYWVALHRCHHQHSDDADDPHSPVAQTKPASFLRKLAAAFHGHIGWVWRHDVPSPLFYARDIYRDKMVNFFDRTYWAWSAVGVILPGLMMVLWEPSWHGFLRGCVSGGLLRIVVCNQLVWSVNSLGHMAGRRPYATRDASRNNLLLVLPGLGEGWHNNHHAFPWSARLGLRCWQIDPGWLLIELFTWLGLATKAKEPTIGQIDSYASRDVSANQRTMDSVSRLLDRFERGDTDWLLAKGVERTVIPGTSVVTEGGPLESLLFVIDGLFDVNVTAFPGQPVARIGPGGVIGEISFLDGQPPAASVVAHEPSRLLEVPRSVLHERFQADPVFAARFYGALGATVAERLRAVRAEAAPAPAVERGLDASPSWLELESLIERLKEQLAELAESAQRGNEPLPAIPPDEVMEHFQFLVLRMNELLGDRSIEPPGFRRLIGKRVQRELLPYALLSRCAERWYTKPRGYAGDFLSIDLMYRNEPAGSSRLGAMVDACFLEIAAVRAVRNRRQLLAGEIHATIASTGSVSVHITSIACGPAAEIFDVYAGLSDPSRLRASLLDVDAEAIAFVRNRVEQTRVGEFVRPVHENPLYLALGQRTVDFEPQDLIYSAGLIDYFNDKSVIRLMNYLHSLLKPGGRLILGNFHPRHTSRALLDHVLEWELIHRDEADMNRLFAASAFGKPCSRILFEEQGINLFAEGVKE